MQSTSVWPGIVPLALAAALLPQDPRAPLELARAEHGRPPEREERVRIPEIAVLVGGEIVVDGDAMPFATVEDETEVLRAAWELSKRIPRIPDEHVPQITYPDRPVLMRADRRLSYERAGRVLEILGEVGIELTLVELEVVEPDGGEPAWLRLAQPIEVGVIRCVFDEEELELRLVGTGEPPIAIFWYLAKDAAKGHDGERSFRFESMDGLLRFLDGGSVGVEAKHLSVLPSLDATWQSVVDVIDALVGAGHGVHLMPPTCLKYGQRSPK